MEVSPQVLTPSTRLSNLTVSKRLHMRDQFAIYFGPIQMRDAVGVSRQEVQDTLSDKTFQNNLIIQMDWLELQERISW